ncbi:hypothetical protein L208DRAFT_1385065 [Tricholoma matsutake]|nr:hypothetical protein L208DRAFT_1385065 [Tricholoma matsutake 945]
MTVTRPPPAATNKDTTVISDGSSSTTSLLPPADIAMSANSRSSFLSPSPQNTLHTHHDLSINTPIANLPTTTPVIPSSNLIQFTSAFTMFSPNTQNQALDLINNSSSSILPSKILFSVLNELPALPSSMDFSYGIHPFIIALTKNKVHIPLTLFTSQSTRKLHTKTTSLKQNTVYNSSGSKCHILDLSQFPKESKMDTIDWHKSWQCYMIFQEIHCDLEVSTRWKEHYLFLSGHDDFHLHFSAILSFDIVECMHYSINPHAFNKDNYLRHLEAVKLEIMSTTIRNATCDLGQESQSSSSKPRHGPQPYDHEKHSRFCPAPMDSTSSFCNQDSKGDTARSSPLCLCCKHTGHKFSDCTEDMMPAGILMYLHYFDSKLTLCSNSSIIFCITFQLNSAKCQCKTDHPSQHACLWCRSSNHGACS